MMGECQSVGTRHWTVWPAWHACAIDNMQLSMVHVPVNMPESLGHLLTL